MTSFPRIGVVLREIMTRVGHFSLNSKLCFQHGTEDGYFAVTRALLGPVAAIMLLNLRVVRDQAT